MMPCSTAADSPAAPKPPLDLAQILAKARAAFGYEHLKAHSGGILLQGTWEGHGLKGTYRLQFTPGGQFLQRLDGRAQDLVAFDGVTGWAVDVSRTPRILEMDDLESAQTHLWVQTGRWLAEDGPFTITVVDGELGADRISLRLRL